MLVGMYGLHVMCHFNSQDKLIPVSRLHAKLSELVAASNFCLCCIATYLSIETS